MVGTGSRGRTGCTWRRSGRTAYRLEVPFGRPRVAVPRPLPLPRRARRDAVAHHVRTPERMVQETRRVFERTFLRARGDILPSHHGSRRRRDADAQVRGGAGRRSRVPPVLSQSAPDEELPDRVRPDAEVRLFGRARVQPPQRLQLVRDLRCVLSGPHLPADEVDVRLASVPGLLLPHPALVQSAVAVRQRLSAVLLQRRPRTALSALPRVGGLQQPLRTSALER